MAVGTSNGGVGPTANDDPVIAHLDPNWGLLSQLLDDSLRVFRVHAVSTVNIAALRGVNVVVDGQPVKGQRIVLLTAQTIKSQNGPWQLPYDSTSAWIRPAGWISNGNVQYRLITVGGAGNTYMGSIWMLNNPYAPVIDRDAQSWQLLGSQLIPLAQNVTTSGVSSANTFEAIDTTLGAVSRTLPIAPPDKTRVEFKHVLQGGTNAVTITCGGTD